MSKTVLARETLDRIAELAYERIMEGETRFSVSLDVIIEGCELSLFVETEAQAEDMVEAGGENDEIISTRKLRRIYFNILAYNYNGLKIETEYDIDYLRYSTARSCY